jgi:hypothetical protein
VVAFFPLEILVVLTKVAPLSQIGEKVSALWPAGGNWCPAVVDALTESKLA